MNSILFVCLGNICRSAMAEGVFKAGLARERLETVNVESAGTSHWHVGDPPDPRAIAAARHQGIDISGQRARQIEHGDFENFDLIIAMDASNQARLEAMAPAAGHRASLAMMLSFSERFAGDVPDPWYGDDDGFPQVLDMLEDACDGLLRYFTETKS